MALCPFEVVEVAGMEEIEGAGGENNFFTFSDFMKFAAGAFEGEGLHAVESITGSDWLSGWFDKYIRHGTWDIPTVHISEGDMQVLAGMNNAPSKADMLERRLIEFAAQILDLSSKLPRT